MPETPTHLQMIQAVVARLSGHSFAIKGWSITLAAGLCALAVNSDSPVIALVATASSLMFWLLDGYFLRQERLFRALYDHVRQAPGDETDYSMDVARFRQAIPGAVRTTVLSVLCVFHGTLAFSTGIVALVLWL